MFGFTSAQTFNESIQDRNTSGAPVFGAAPYNELTRGLLTKWPMQSWSQLYVTHMWKYIPGGGLGGLIKNHHSLIMVSRPGYSGKIIPIFYIDLVQGTTKKSVVRVVNAAKKEVHGYTASSTYSPNPIVKSGIEVLAAYDYAVDKMAERYNILTNNCQKFGRIFMTQLGAVHTRNHFHF